MKLGKNGAKMQTYTKGAKATLQNSHLVYPLLIYNFNLHIIEILSHWYNSSAYSRRRDGTEVA